VADGDRVGRLQRNGTPCTWDAAEQSVGDGDRGRVPFALQSPPLDTFRLSA
jgi:hypothetical protein